MDNFINYTLKQSKNDSYSIESLSSIKIDYTYYYLINLFIIIYSFY